jgi:Zn finger protein HypA/HybF involved in hydrogenase expression
MNREQRRAAAKQAKQDGNQELSEKITLFGKLGDSCLTCDKPFDKKDKEMVMSWSVVVKEHEGVVRLYCPDCWSRAVEIMEDFRQRLEEREE